MQLVLRMPPHASRISHSGTHKNYFRRALSALRKSELWSDRRTRNVPRSM